MPTYFCHTCMDNVDVSTDAASSELVCRECGQSFVEVVESGAQDPGAFYEGDDDGEDDDVANLYELMRQMANQGAPRAARSARASTRSSASSRSSASRRRPAARGNADEEDEDDEEQDEEDLAFQRFMRHVQGPPRANAAQQQQQQQRQDMSPMDMFMQQMLGGLMGIGGTPLRRGGPNRGDFVAGNRDLEEVLAQLFAASGTSSAPPPTRKSFLDALPRTKLTARDLRNGDKDCAVCQEGFTVGETTMQLSCRHRFHAQCLEPWLKTNNTCPVCRHELPAEEESGSSEASPARGLFATGLGNAMRLLGGARRGGRRSGANGRRGGHGSQGSSASSDSR